MLLLLFVLINMMFITIRLIILRVLIVFRLVLIKNLSSRAVYFRYWCVLLQCDGPNLICMCLASVGHLVAMLVVHSMNFAKTMLYLQTA